MPKAKPAVKLSGQREHFAREYVRLGNASRAYRHAYNVTDTTKPETIWSAASKILADHKVAQRVSELKALAAERAVVSRASIIADLGQSRELAMEIENPSAAVSASMGQAKVGGFLAPTKLEHSGPNGAAIAVEEQITVEDRSRYDFARRVALLLAKGKGQLKLAKPSSVEK